MIDGPFLKWKKEYDDSNGLVQLDDFAMNFYLAFRGGNGGKKPRAILYDNFYIVAFPKDQELCCLFMRPQGIEKNIQQLHKVASRIMSEMEEREEKDREVSCNEDEIEEVRRLIVNLLNDTEMSTPELRKYFKLSNAQIWKVVTDLENARQIRRTEKKEGRAVFWTTIVRK